MKRKFVVVAFCILSVQIGDLKGMDERQELTHDGKTTGLFSMPMKSEQDEHLRDKIRNARKHENYEKMKQFLLELADTTADHKTCHNAHFIVGQLYEKEKLKLSKSESRLKQVEHYYKIALLDNDCGRGIDRDCKKRCLCRLAGYYMDGELGNRTPEDYKRAKVYLACAMTPNGWFQLANLYIDGKLGKQTRDNLKRAVDNLSLAIEEKHGIVDTSMCLSDEDWYRAKLQRAQTLHILNTGDPMTDYLEVQDSPDRKIRQQCYLGRADIYHHGRPRICSDNYKNRVDSAEKCYLKAEKGPDAERALQCRWERIQLYLTGLTGLPLPKGCTWTPRYKHALECLGQLGESGTDAQLQKRVRIKFRETERAQRAWNKEFLLQSPPPALQWIVVR